ncbi:MAG TPA: hypothetical protein VF188_09115 [Longimicrobiales bacterium]
MKRTFRRTRGSMLVPLALVLLAAAPAAAQEEKAAATSPAADIARLLEFYNRAATIRMTGPARIAAGTEIVGDVGVVNGPFVIEGRIRGRVVVLNGDVRFAPGARIIGDLTVAGGAILGLDSATVTGTVLRYRKPVQYREDDGRLVAVVPEEAPVIAAGHDFPFGRTDLLLATWRGYNRVEGLPVAIGPRFQTRSRNPTRASALLIYRTESGFEPDADELGYVLRLEQFLGGRRIVRLGATLHSEIVPIEAWGLSDRENSLSTFLFHRDYRDHYEREGWSAYLRIAPPGQPHELTIEYRDERHRSVRANAPPAILGDDDWRRQPLVAEGTLRTLALRLGYDTRNAGGHPTAGWYIRAEVERGLGGSLALGGTCAFPVEPEGFCLAASRSAGTEFAAGLADVRRYARVGPQSWLAVRALFATSLNDRPLPPQRQHALGGEGSLPGYDHYRFDCGARAAVAPAAPDFFPYYGCDRLALVQIEYQAAFPFGHDWGRKLGWDLDLGGTPAWVVFFDAGRAWTERVALGGRTPGQDDFAADAGAGFRLGSLGLYWAIPLSGRDEGVNFFVRFGARL